MKESSIRQIPSRPRLFTALTLAALILPPQISLAGDISGSINAGANGSLVISLAIPAPPPASVIVTCQMPTGTDITNAAPVPKKKNPEKGLAKWLVKTPDSGDLAISFTPAPLPEGKNISCEVSYNDPASGRMMTITIR